MVGLLNDTDEEYHLYLTNLAEEDYSAPDIAQLYRARWEVELLFKELKSRFGLDEINTTDAYVIEALIIMAAISLMMSRVIVDELQKLDAKERESADDAGVICVTFECHESGTGVMALETGPLRYNCSTAL